MKAILLAVAVASSVLIASSLYNASTSKQANPLFDEDLDKAFDHWMMQNGKSYGNHSDKDYRKGVFAQNRITVQENVQDSNATYKLGLNQFADLTVPEFRSKYMGIPESSEVNVNEDDHMKEYDESDDEEHTLNVPSSVDWVTAGHVTAVKDQGQCGSCWAFSAIGAIESLFSKTYGYQLIFSEQQLVDCSRSYGPRGCHGGWPHDAFKYVSHSGITQSYFYPYTGTENQCQTYKIDTPWKIRSHHRLWNTENDLQKWLAVQPVSMSFNADNFMLYQSGIYNSPCNTQNTHAVLAVGYGQEYGQKYFKFKNSWGTWWGESGYFRIAMVGDNRPGKCGSTMFASFPQL